MPKKKGGGGGGANWMDTYGDMVTLLLCFFVLLYSMSSISEENWKHLVQSFNPNSILTQTDPMGNSGPFADPDVGQQNPGLQEAEMSQNEIDNMMEELFMALQDYTKQEGLESAVSVSMDGGLIYLKLMNKAMFRGDSYDLLPDAKNILGGVCNILDNAKPAIEEIRVEGHTAQQFSNKANETRGDRRLASNRATEVTIFLQDHTTIHPARICSVGWGQWHAIANNQNEENRAPNRRVELVISARNLEDEDLGSTLSQFITDSNAADQTSAGENP